MEGVTECPSYRRPTRLRLHLHCCCSCCCACALAAFGAAARGTYHGLTKVFNPLFMCVPSAGSQSESHGSASNASATSVRSNRSNSVAPGKVSGGAHHERHGSSHRQHQHQHHSHLQSPQEESLITNITTNPVAESVTVEIIEPGEKK